MPAKSSFKVRYIAPCLPPVEPHHSGVVDCKGEAVFHPLGIIAKHGVAIPAPLEASTTHSALVLLQQNKTTVPDGVLIYLANSVKRIEPSQLLLVIQHTAPLLSSNDGPSQLVQQLLKLAVREVDETVMTALLQLVSTGLSNQDHSEQQQGLRLWTCLNRYAHSAVQLKLARQASSRITESLLASAITAECFHDLARALTSTLMIGLSPIPSQQAEALLQMATLLAAFACLSREATELAAYHQSCHSLLQTMLSRQRPAVDGASAVVISLLSKQLTLYALVLLLHVQQLLFTPVF
jgi:signal transduction histidine kinase